MSFRNNDSSVGYELKFKMPKENEQLIQYTLSREMVYHVLLQQLYDQDTGDPHYIKPSSLTMEGNRRHYIQICAVFFPPLSEKVVHLMFCTFFVPLLWTMLHTRDILYMLCKLSVEHDFSSLIKPRRNRQKKAGHW